MPKDMSFDIAHNIIACDMQYRYCSVFWRCGINWKRSMWYRDYIDGLVQDCSNSSALAVELLQSCTEPLICSSYKIWQSPDSKVHGANTGPIWGWQGPGGPHDGPWTLLSGSLYSWMFFFLQNNFHPKLVTIKTTMYIKILWRNS